MVDADISSGPEIDAIALGAVSIDTVHDRIHEGQEFSISDRASPVNIATPKKYLITTPNTGLRAHFVFRVHTEPGSRVQFFEDTTVTANGTAMTPQNNNRNRTKASQLSVFAYPTVTADGTSLFDDEKGTAKIGSTKGVGLELSHANEIILKQNTKYELKITPLSNNTVASTQLDWYEVTAPPGV